jgi:hypothetical protein
MKPSHGRARITTKSKQSGEHCLSSSCCPFPLPPATTTKQTNNNNKANKQQQSKQTSFNPRKPDEKTRREKPGGKNQDGKNQDAPQVRPDQGRALQTVTTRNGKKNFLKEKNI